MTVAEPVGTRRVAWGARTVLPEWRRLGAGRARPVPFDPMMVDELPEPARRWLRHAVAPGTPLAAATVLMMHGTIRLGRWRRFTATQVLAPTAFRGATWTAGDLPDTVVSLWRAHVPVMQHDGQKDDRHVDGRKVAARPESARRRRARS